MSKKEKRPIVTIEGTKVCIRRKRKCESSYLNFCCGVSFDYSEKVLAPVNSMTGYIQVSSDIYEKLKSNYGTLVNLNTGSFAQVYISNKTIQDRAGFIRYTRYIKKELGITRDSELALCKGNYTEFSDVSIQLMENIKSDIVSIPEGMLPEAYLRSFSLFEVINVLTNDRILVKSKNIVADNTSAEEDQKCIQPTIKLNMKHRKLLGDNVPARLSFAQWEKLVSDEGVKKSEADAQNAEARVKETDDESKKAAEIARKVADNARKTLEAVKEAFEKEYIKESFGYTVKESMDDMPYATKVTIQNAVKRNLGVKIILRPVIESFCYKERKSVVTLLSDFYIGKSTLTLNCRRPHECDENADVVRMTEDNMRFLGIEPMDKVVLRFKNRKKDCHVLPYDASKYTNTNVPGVIELAVGIPAYIRDELGITDIQSSVKVERDTKFIFRKCFNEQLVPIMLALFSINVFDGLKKWVSTLIILGSIPVIMYISLTPKRNMREK